LSISRTSLEELAVKHTLRFRSAILATLVAALACFGATGARADDAINVYGPGGPAPAMKEAAQAFGAANKVTVNVVAGPTPQWVEKAKADADVVFSGAENMMSDFAKALPGAFDLKSAEPMYLRPVAILVRPGNPKHIKGFRDVLAPGVKVLAVAGAGQNGLWEDVAGRTGDRTTRHRCLADLEHLAGVEPRTRATGRDGRAVPHLPRQRRGAHAQGRCAAAGEGLRRVSAVTGRAGNLCQVGLESTLKRPGAFHDVPESSATAHS